MSESPQNTTKRTRFKKKRYLIPAIVLVALIIFRIMLPTIVKNYVNKVLADIPGYYGQVEDIDISLIRGAYVINGLYLNKVNAETQVPFLNFPKTDISVEWKSIFKGKIVSEIEMYDPEVTYVFEDQQKGTTDGDAGAEDWTKALTDLVPIDINHYEIHNGKIGFVKLQADPNLDLYMDKVNLTADNLRNVVEKGVNLPSPITATAVSIGQGAFKLNGGMNLIKEIPDMDLNFSLENANITSLNDMTSYYAGIDFKKGKIDVFGELAIADGYLKGYVKPIVKDAKLISKEDGILETIWEGFVSMFTFVLKNQGNNTFATRIPLEGSLDNVGTNVWAAAGNIFKNAWISAFKGEIDQKIEFKDALNDAEYEKLDKDDKRAYKKQQRQQKREKKKEEREQEKKDKEE